MKIDPYLSPCTKLKSKWIKNLNIKLDTLNLIEEKVGKSHELIGKGKSFLNRIPMTHALRSTIDKRELMKLESFCKTKDIVNKTNRQPTNWGEKSSLTPHSIDGYYPKYKRTQNIKELKNLTTRKTEQPNQK